jgi:hypothetical protein
VPLKTYDESISVLRRSLDAAKVGDAGKLQGFARLDRFVRSVKQNCATAVDFEAAVADDVVLRWQIAVSGPSAGTNTGRKRYVHLNCCRLGS